MKFNEKIPVAYCAKYALTKGILEFKDTRVWFPNDGGPAPKDGEEPPPNARVYLSIPGQVFGHLGDVMFLTRAEAVAKAEKMRDSAIKAAERKIDKLKKMRF
jgi:hypothetical protein